MINNTKKRKDFQLTDQHNQHKYQSSGSTESLSHHKKNKTERKIKDEFSKLPSEIYHQILCYLTIDDSAVCSFLKIGRGVCMTMLGISDFAYFELRRDFVDSSQYYRTLTLLSIRNVLERLSRLCRRKISMKYGENDGGEDFMDEDFGNLSMGESYFTTSKLFYRFVGAIRELNKLFPYWLTPHVELSDSSLIISKINQSINLKNIYNTLLDIKRELSGAEYSLYYDIYLDEKFNTILFDSKRFKKSTNKERNWKLIFQKQLEKVKHHEFVSLVKVFKKNDHTRVWSEQYYKPLERIIELLKGMNQRTRIFFLFERNYSCGGLSPALKRQVNFKNQFLSLHQHVLYVTSVAFDRYGIINHNEIKYQNLLVDFTELVYENWKQFYKMNNIELPEREILNDFLLDGPRTNMRNISLLMNNLGFNHVYKQFPNVFDDYFPKCNEWMHWRSTRNIRYYPRYRYRSQIRKL